MAQPTAYTRQYNFNDFSTTSPSDPLPGVQVDNELNKVKTNLDGLNANIALVQRDDGKLANQSVHKNSFDTDALALIGVSGYTVSGSWAANTAYALGTLVDYNDATYLSTVAHTSGTVFATDLTAGKWILLANAAINTSGSAVDKFEGTGSQTQFTLSYTYSSTTDFLVFVNGALRNPNDDYTLSGTTLTLATPPSAPSVSGNENVIVWGASVTVQSHKNAAAASANNASGFATSASNAKTAAETARDLSIAAKTDAQTAQAAAEAALDTFSDKFLGALGSNPALDNDGNALVDGALFFDTTLDLMKVYDLTNTTWRVVSLSSTDQAFVNALATTANIANMAALNGSGVITNMANLNGSGVITNMANLNASGVIANMANLNASGVISNMANLNATGVITNMANLNASGVISNIAIVAADTADIGAVASNISGVNSFADRYRVASSAPSSSLDAGDLYFNTSTNELRAYNGSAWQATAPSATDQVNINIVAGEITSTEDLGSITASIDTSSGNNIDTVANAITNINAVAGANSNISALNATGVISNMAALNATGVITNIGTVATNVAGVTSFAEKYRVESSAPSSSLNEGDLYYNTSTNSLNYYNGSSWIAVVAGAMTSLVVDTTPELGGNLDVVTHSIVSTSNRDITIAPHGSGEINLNGTVNTDNLTMDFGSIA